MLQTRWLEIRKIEARVNMTNIFHKIKMKEMFARAQTAEAPEELDVLGRAPTKLAH